MRRFLLLKPNLTFALVLSAFAFSSAGHAGGKPTRMRVDCRFYSDAVGFCYSSAMYKVSRDDIHDIRYGVGCNYETIFDDEGTASPQEEVSDSLRPRTAALPRVEITPKRSLHETGTYTAKLEVASGKLTDGTCYVREVSDDEGEYDLSTQAWMFAF